MDEFRILVTGEYWHRDFGDLLPGLEATITLIPPSQLSEFDFSASCPQLVIVAEARRGQLSQELIETLRRHLPQVPLVALKGSLCEGEIRSGTPLDGVVPVYWHQWQGRYESFRSQLAASGITDWHQPATSSISDRFKRRLEQRTQLERESVTLGISAWSRDNFDYLQEAVQYSGWNAIWIEQTSWDSAAVAELQAICVDANSVTEDMLDRLRWLANSFPHLPLVAILNFPRSEDWQRLSELGVRAVVSKPFELQDLHNAVMRSLIPAASASAKTEEL